MTPVVEFGPHRFGSLSRGYLALPDLVGIAFICGAGEVSVLKPANSFEPISKFFKS